MYAFPKCLPVSAEYLTNLEFFVREGMSEGDGCDYVIIVQEVSVSSVVVKCHRAHLPL